MAMVCGGSGISAKGWNHRIGVVLAQFVLSLSGIPPKRGGIPYEEW